MSHGVVKNADDAMSGGVLAREWGSRVPQMPREAVLTQSTCCTAELTTRPWAAGPAPEQRQSVLSIGPPRQRCPVTSPPWPLPDGWTSQPRAIAPTHSSSGAGRAGS